MPNSLLTLIGKAARKPPHVVAHRLVSESRRMLDRYTLGDHSWPGLNQVLAELKASSLETLWSGLASRRYVTAAVDPRALQLACPAEEQQAILDLAERALRHEVDLLGSGPVHLGERIQWNCDYKTGHCWPNQFAADIEYANLDQPSDVKFPWELSRQQWLIPVGQAYVLTGDRRYAEAARDTLDDWIDANPYAWSVNWSCTMEAALRIITWTWLFHMFHGSEAWREPAFRARFVTALFAHARFTEQYLEYSDVNGNHCTADAAGLVFAGLFFGGGDQRGPRAAVRWQRAGWRLLQRELPKQVTADGVDFEGSVPYHRLCAELFFLPARYRERIGLPGDAAYRQRVLEIARFTQAYTKPNGLAPLWGDADDARTLPLGRQQINDHRYLPSLIGGAWQASELVDRQQSNQGECLWMLGPAPASGSDRPRRSIAFAEAGYFVMRNECDHVFIDAAPVGLAGRGGHGHNDCLALEVVLRGVPLVTDCGAFIYTGCYAQRNRFRSTGSHNTPKIDGEEINRFHGPKALWTLHDDARPTVRQWEPGERTDVLEASHSGYHKLAPAVTPVRRIVLDHIRHEVTISDRFEAAGESRRAIEIPLHFDPAVALEPMGDCQWRLAAGGERFQLSWEAEGDWRCEAQPCHVSPSYGVRRESHRLVWCFAGPVSAASLTVAIRPWC